jgi:hypothetical protein
MASCVLGVRLERPIFSVNFRFRLPSTESACGGDNPETFHDLRRTYLSNWLAQGLSEFKVMRLAGHAKFETTRQFWLIRFSRTFELKEWTCGLIQRYGSKFSLSTLPSYRWSFSASRSPPPRRLSRGGSRENVVSGASPRRRSLRSHGPCVGEVAVQGPTPLADGP